ncbi:MAG: hypothetical protein GEV04_24790 [Actinophytocola sp.]|nr:hypothetical protein [Actinophytocola sp.]
MHVLEYPLAYLIVAWFLLVPPVTLVLQLTGALEIDDMLLSLFGVSDNGAGSFGDWAIVVGLYLVCYVGVLVILDFVRLPVFYLVLVPRALLLLLTQSLSLGKHHDSDDWDRHPARWLALTIVAFGFHWDILAA